MKRISILTCAVPLEGTGSLGQPNRGKAVPDDKEIVDAYTYLYASYLVLQQENHDINMEKVGYNKVKYNPLGSAAFVIRISMWHIWRRGSQSIPTTPSF
jgi:hypothetical protein